MKSSDRGKEVFTVLRKGTLFGVKCDRIGGTNGSEEDSRHSLTFNGDKTGVEIKKSSHFDRRVQKQLAENNEC